MALNEWEDSKHTLTHARGAWRCLIDEQYLNSSQNALNAQILGAIWSLLLLLLLSLVFPLLFVLFLYIFFYTPSVPVYRMFWLF